MPGVDSLSKYPRGSLHVLHLGLRDHVSMWFTGVVTFWVICCLRSSAVCFCVWRLVQTLPLGIRHLASSASEIDLSAWCQTSRVRHLVQTLPLLQVASLIFSSVCCPSSFHWLHHGTLLCHLSIQSTLGLLELLSLVKPTLMKESEATVLPPLLMLRRADNFDCTGHSKVLSPPGVPSAPCAPGY